MFIWNHSLNVNTLHLKGISAWFNRRCWWGRGGLWGGITEAEDAGRKRPAVPLTMARVIPGILMLIHRRGWGAEQPSKQWQWSQKVWPAVSQALKGMSGRAPTPTGGCCSTQRPACKEGPLEGTGNGAKMERGEMYWKWSKGDGNLETGK